MHLLDSNIKPNPQHKSKLAGFHLRLLGWRGRGHVPLQPQQLQLMRLQRAGGVGIVPLLEAAVDARLHESM
jgi:hypothetical protein